MINRRHSAAAATDLETSNLYYCRARPNYERAQGRPKKQWQYEVEDDVQKLETEEWRVAV